MRQSPGSVPLDYENLLSRGTCRLPSMTTEMAPAPAYRN